MVFDIRGRRGVAVKFVYAILAMLMVASLFLVTGAINLNTIFGNGSTGESAASSFQKQAENIEAKLKKEPESEDLLASLTRTRINAANSMITGGAGDLAERGRRSQTGTRAGERRLVEIPRRGERTERRDRPAGGAGAVPAGRTLAPPALKRAKT